MPYNITVSEAARQLGLSAPIVRQMIQRGELAACRFGGPSGHYRISRESLDALIDKSRVDGGDVYQAAA
jgi:excisionase family DNA binding protein